MESAKERRQIFEEDAGTTSNWRVGFSTIKKAPSPQESEDQSEWKICVRSNEEKQKLWNKQSEVRYERPAEAK